MPVGISLADRKRLARGNRNENAVVKHRRGNLGRRHLRGDQCKYFVLLALIVLLREKSGKLIGELVCYRGVIARDRPLKRIYKGVVALIKCPELNNSVLVGVGILGQSKQNLTDVVLRGHNSVCLVCVTAYVGKIFDLGLVQCCAEIETLSHSREGYVKDSRLLLKLLATA